MKKKKMGVMDKVLIIVGITLLSFTIIMTIVYCFTGGIPDTLVSCVFAVCGGECGVMGWIKTSKEKNTERKFDLEDRIYNDTRDGIDLQLLSNGSDCVDSSMINNWDTETMRTSGNTPGYSG